MSTVSMSGSDTLMINNRVLADLADGDCATLTFPNDIATVKTGKNIMVISAKNPNATNTWQTNRIIS